MLRAVLFGASLPKHLYGTVQVRTYVRMGTQQDVDEVRWQGVNFTIGGVEEEANGCLQHSKMARGRVVDG